MKRTLALIVILAATSFAVERRIETVTHARSISQITGVSYWQLIGHRSPIELLGIRFTETYEPESEETNEI